MAKYIAEHKHIFDALTERAIKVFLGKLSLRYSFKKSILFGSRARQTHCVESDADIAIILDGDIGKRSLIAMDMAGFAF
jgi:uncharacterized protein